MFLAKIKFPRNKITKTLKFETAVKVLKHVPHMNTVHDIYFLKLIFLFYL